MNEWLASKHLSEHVIVTQQLNDMLNEYVEMQRKRVALGLFTVSRSKEGLGEKRRNLKSRKLT